MISSAKCFIRHFICRPSKCPNIHRVNARTGSDSTFEWLIQSQCGRNLNEIQLCLFLIWSVASDSSEDDTAELQNCKFGSYWILPFCNRKPRTKTKKTAHLNLMEITSKIRLNESYAIVEWRTLHFTTKASNVLSFRTTWWWVKSKSEWV